MSSVWLVMSGRGCAVVPGPAFDGVVVCWWLRGLESVAGVQAGDGGGGAPVVESLPAVCAVVGEPFADDDPDDAEEVTEAVSRVGEVVDGVDDPQGVGAEAGG